MNRFIRCDFKKFYVEYRKYIQVIKIKKDKIIIKAEDFEDEFYKAYNPNFREILDTIYKN